jgi:outer membrane protein assembly factor BamB
LWSYETGDIDPAVVAKGGVVYVNSFAAFSETLAALNATTGKVIWAHSLTDGGNQDFAPAVAGNTVSS